MINQPLKPSWDSSCVESLLERINTVKAWLASEVAALPRLERERIAEDWYEKQVDKLDRIYLQTAMPESDYKRFTRLIDNAYYRAMR